VLEIRFVRVLTLLPVVACLPAQRLQFADPVTVPISHSFAGPYKAAVGDLNRDGVPDIVIAQVDAPEIVVIPGSPDRQYRPDLRIPTPAPCGPIAITDFDADGVPDIVAVCGTNTGFILLLRGKGDLTFIQHGRIPLASGIRDMLAADLNGDGSVDLAVTQARTITIFFGNGDGTFQPPVPVALSETPALIRQGDFDADGKPDLAVMYYLSSRISVLFNKGAGEFRDPIDADAADAADASSTVKGLTVADFDGDGKLDLAVCSSSYLLDTVTILTGDGSGAFAAKNTIVLDHGYQPTTMESADLDGDGLPDLIVGHYYSGMIRVLRNQGGGNMSVRSFDIPGDMFTLALADLDGDGKVDLVVPSHSGNIVAMGFGQGDASFSPVRFLGSQLDLAFTADLDRDGNSDSAVLDFLAGGLHLLRRGTERVGGLYVDTGIPYGAVMADFNRDGIADFAISSGPMSWTNMDAPAWLTVFLGNGDFTFRAVDPISFEPWGGEMVVADFNGDGIPDLAAAGIDSVNVRLGKGDGRFDPPRKAFASAASPLAFADLNRDGKADLLVRDAPSSTYSSASLSVLLNSGDGTFRQGQKLQEDRFGTHSAVIADLNGDGIPDLVAGATENIYIFIGKGDGTFTAKSPLNRPTANLSNQYYPSVFDVDGDGVPDIVAPNGNGNCADTFFGKGDGSFSAPLTLPAGAIPISVSAADFDGDGKTDLMFPNILKGTVTVLKTGLPR
jgi:VCBS repeat protein